MDVSMWLWVAIAAGVLAVPYGVFSTTGILRLPAGNARMQEIAAAVQAGAKAYLNRQYRTILIVGVVLFLVIGISRKSTTPTIRMVRYWRLRYALAPACTAAAISCMRALPAGRRRIPVVENTP